MPHLFERIGAAAKAFRQVFAGTDRERPPTYGTRFRDPIINADFIPANAFGDVLERDDDTIRAGELYANSAVAICLDWKQRNFPEADLVIEKETPGKGSVVQDGHPLIALLDDPVPIRTEDFYSLWAATLLSYDTDGNAYWIKAKDARGRVKELWWTPHWLIEPRRADPDSPDIYYRYCITIANQELAYRLDPSDIVHFKYGTDPLNPLKGISPLKRQLRQVISDNEVGNYTASLLFNRGVPGLLVIPDSEKIEMTEAAATVIKDRVNSLTRGRKRGDTVVMSGPVRIEQPAFSPDQMNLNEISRIPEARICAALGVPPMVVGLNIGDAQKTYSNLREAIRDAWRNLRSLQGRMAEALYRQLLPDFERDVKPFRVAWEYARVEALQEDRDAVHKRAGEAFATYQYAKRSEARRMVGLEPAEDGSDDVYFLEFNATVATEIGSTLTPTGRVSLAGLGATNGKGLHAPSGTLETRERRLVVRDGGNGTTRRPGPLADRVSRVLAKIEARLDGGNDENDGRGSVGTRIPAPAHQNEPDRRSGLRQRDGQQDEGRYGPGPGGREGRDDLSTDRRQMGNPAGFRTGTPAGDVRDHDQYVPLTHEPPGPGRGDGLARLARLADEGGADLGAGAARSRSREPVFPAEWQSDRDPYGPDFPGSAGGDPGVPPAAGPGDDSPLGPVPGPLPGPDDLGPEPPTGELPDRGGSGDGPVSGPGPPSGPGPAGSGDGAGGPDRGPGPYDNAGAAPGGVQPAEGDEDGDWPDSDTE